MFRIYRCKVNEVDPRVVEVAKNYIDQIGGYEALAEWGLWCCFTKIRS